MSFQTPNPSIWVGGLEPELTEQKLYDFFVRVGPIASVRVCVDSMTHKSLGYGYVNFQEAADAEKALDLAGSQLGTKFLRISRIQRDPSKRRSGLNNIVVKRLPAQVDTHALKDAFSKFGRLTAVSLACNEKGESRGYARISFEREESAQEAVREMDGIEFDGQPVTVERFQAQHREELLKQYVNLYVKNLNPNTTDEELLEFFSQMGTVTSAKVRKLEEGKSPCGFGYVAYEKHEDADRAVKELSGKPCPIAMEGMNLDVSRFRAREERLREKERARRERAQQFSKYPNLYVKGFDDTVTSDRLKELFERYGETVSVTVMMDTETNLSRCFGFVSMKDQNAASQAIQELNGSTFLCAHPLFVTYAVRRDARRQNLEERSKQYRMRPNPMPGMGNMPPMNFMGPQMFNNMNMPFNMGRMPVMPMPMGGPLRPMGPTPMNQMRAARPLSQRPPMQSMMPQMPPQPPAQSQNLSALLATLSPDQQKNVLGERLYTYMVRNNPTVAAKITGMLLEMDNAEILTMLEKPSILDGKIEEAKEVLSRHLNA